MLDIMWFLQKAFAGTVVCQCIYSLVNTKKTAIKNKAKVKSLLDAIVYSEHEFTHQMQD
jgi:hypothetical protein